MKTETQVRVESKSSLDQTQCSNGVRMLQDILDLVCGLIEKGGEDGLNDETLLVIRDAARKGRAEPSYDLFELLWAYSQRPVKCSKRSGELIDVLEQALSAGSTLAWLVERMNESATVAA